MSITISKRPLKFVVFLFLITFGVPTQTSIAAQKTWELIGLSDLRIRVLAIDPQNPTSIYAGTNQGIFKNVDGSKSWFQINNGLIDLRIYALAIDPKQPNTLFAGTFEEGIFKSVDGGSTWQQVYKEMNEPFTQVTVLVIDPQYNNRIYAGMYRDGIHKSTDGGNIWNPSGNGLFAPDINAIVIDPQNTNILYLSANGIPFRSSDGGKNWREVTEGFPESRPWVNQFAINPKNTRTIYAGTEYGIYKSTDGAVSWDAYHEGIENIEVISLTVDPHNPDIIYAGTNGNGIFKSTNGGLSWTDLSGGLTNLVVNTMIINPLTGDVYAGTDQGIFRLEQIKIFLPLIRR